MPHRVSKTGSELFIVDNSDEDWKVLRYLRVVAPFPEERPSLVIPDRLYNFLAGVHHEGTVAGDRLAQRPAGEQQEPHRYAGNSSVGGTCPLLHALPLWRSGRRPSP